VLAAASLIVPKRTSGFVPALDGGFVAGTSVPASATLTLGDVDFIIVASSNFPNWMPFGFKCGLEEFRGGIVTGATIVFLAAMLFHATVVGFGAAMDSFWSCFEVDLASVALEGATFGCDDLA